MSHKSPQKDNGYLGHSEREIRHNVMMSVWRLTDNKQLSNGGEAAAPDRKRERTTNASKPGWLDSRRSERLMRGAGYLSKLATYEVHGGDVRVLHENSNSWTTLCSKLEALTLLNRTLPSRKLLYRKELNRTLPNQ